MKSVHVDRKPPQKRVAFCKFDKPYPISLFKNQKTNPIFISSSRKPHPTLAGFGIPWVFSVKSLMVYTVYKYFYIYYVCKNFKEGKQDIQLYKTYLLHCFHNFPSILRRPFTLEKYVDIYSIPKNVLKKNNII